MQRDFFALADHLDTLTRDGEVYLCWFDGENSDFVRFNRSRIRQSGRVTQQNLNIDLIEGDRHTSGSIALTGILDTDRTRAGRLVDELRSRLPHLPADPYLLYSTTVASTEHHRENRLPPPERAIEEVLDAGRDRDLVGLYAAGGIHTGFASSFGQRNWFSTYSFNLDWSFYAGGDKAVKLAYAGFEWDAHAFQRKVDEGAAQLEILSRPPRTVEPGHYRVYLAPAAVSDLVGTMCWGGFGLKALRTKSSSLLRMAEEGARLHPSVSIHENTAEGVSAAFQGQGFIKPDRVTLISSGSLKDPLVSPRSAREFGVPTNGASGWEVPESLDMAGGEIPAREITRRLDEGVYINNLHYLNYSDRPAGRITGMSRFATFWVEQGEIVAPLNVMRFDETIYRCLGEKLIGLTREREFFLDPGTYGGRSTGSVRVPGALVDEFTFTL